MNRQNKYYSLSTKICLSFVLLSILIFSVTTISLYFILKYYIYQSSSSFLENEVSLVTNIIQKHPHDTNALRQEIIWEPKINDNKFMIRIIDHQGNVLIQTKDIEQIIPNQYLVANKKVLLAFDKTLMVKSIHGKRYYRLLYESINNPSAKKTNSPTPIMVAVDVSREYRVLNHYKNYLILIFVFGVLISWLLAYFVSRWLVKPVRKLADKITDMSIENMDEKVTFYAGSKEVNILIQEFNDMLERISKSYQQIRNFTSDVAHELRTPINNMMLACEDYFSTKKNQETNPDDIIELTIDECKHVAKIIEQLLFIVKADAMKVELLKTNINIFEEIKKLTDYFSVLASKYKIQFQINGNKDIYASVDKMLFLRAISNLITNAIKYTNPGGRIKLNFFRQNNDICIEVQDTGIGIAENDIEFIFDRFYRADQSRNKQTGGYGLGLSIVKSIMDLHNGQVTVASQLNVGTVFTLQFACS